MVNTSMVRSATSKLLFTTLCVMLASTFARMGHAADEKINALGGEWLYVKDITKDRPIEQQGPPMSVKFKLRIEMDGVYWERPRGDERMPIDGSTYDRKNNNGSFTRFKGTWKEGVLHYTLETIRDADKSVALKIHREFRMTKDGMQLSVSLNDGKSSVAIYRHPEDVELPAPAKATIADVSWLCGAWLGSTGTRSTEERWTPAKGGAILGVSRTIRGEKMVAFEYLRIVEKDGGLVYVAQPGGKTATEFVLTELKDKKVVFKNPRHDYPQRIIYELSKDGMLTANIGFAIGGKGRSFEFKKESK